MCLVTWPWFRSEAGGDVLSIQTSYAVCMLSSFHLQIKSSEVCKQTKLIAGLTLRQKDLFGPIFQLVQLVFFRARVTMGKTNGSCLKV